MILSLDPGPIRFFVSHYTLQKLLDLPMMIDVVVETSSIGGLGSPSDRDQYHNDILPSEYRYTIRSGDLNFHMRHKYWAWARSRRSREMGFQMVQEKKRNEGKPEKLKMNFFLKSFSFVTDIDDALRLKRRREKKSSSDFSSLIYAKYLGDLSLIHQLIYWIFLFLIGPLFYWIYQKNPVV